MAWKRFKKRSNDASNDASNDVTRPPAAPVPFLVRHGDVLVQRVSGIPAHAKKRAGQVLVRGEATGHSHRVGESGAGVIFETVDEMFLQIVAPIGTLIHEEHSPIELAAGSYRVWTQREYTPQRIVRVVD